MADMSPRGALTLAIFALNTLTDPDASSPADLTYLDAHAVDALATLARMREQEPASEGRCAQCGQVLSAAAQYVLRRTGFDQWTRVEDLAVCTGCPNVLTEAAVEEARRQGWTRGSR
jgi:hypothetical protein